MLLLLFFYEHVSKTCIFEETVFALMIFKKSYVLLLNCYKGLNLFSHNDELYLPGAEHLCSGRKRLSKQLARESAGDPT